MKSTERKQILSTLIDGIAGAANEEYQKRVWIEGKGPECEDFEEFVNYFLLECKGVLKNYKDFKITELQYQLLKEFEEEVRTFSNEANINTIPKVFLKSPQWKKIIKLAKDVLKVFNYQKNDA